MFKSGWLRDLFGRPGSRADNRCEGLSVEQRELLQGIGSVEITVSLLTADQSTMGAIDLYETPEGERCITATQGSLCFNPADHPICETLKSWARHEIYSHDLPPNTILEDSYERLGYKKMGFVALDYEGQPEAISYLFFQNDRGERRVTAHSTHQATTLSCPSVLKAATQWVNGRCQLGNIPNIQTIPQEKTAEIVRFVRTPR